MQDLIGLEFARLVQYRENARLTELVSVGRSSFRNAIGEDTEHIPGLQVSFPNRTIPVSEQAENRGSRFETLNLSTLAKQERRAVAAVYIRQAASMVVVASEENRGIAIGFSVLVRWPLTAARIAGSSLARHSARL